MALSRFISACLFSSRRLPNVAELRVLDQHLAASSSNQAFQSEAVACFQK